MDLKEDYEIKSRTISLKKTFGTKHIQYIKTIYNFSIDSVVWIIRIDSTEQYGFENYFLMII